MVRGQWVNLARMPGYTHALFLMTTESQDLGFKLSSEGWCFFRSIVSRPYTGALGPTQTAGDTPCMVSSNTSSSSNLVFQEVSRPDTDQLNPA